MISSSRTSTQDPSIRPPGDNRNNAFYILEQGEYEGEADFWVEDEEEHEGFIATEDEETFRVLEENDAFIAGKTSGRNLKFKAKENQETKRALSSTQPMQSWTTDVLGPWAALARNPAFYTGHQEPHLP